MPDNTSAEQNIIPDMLHIAVREIEKKAIDLHAQFDKEWNKPSYHNEYHIMGSLEAVNAVFDSAQSEDPLEVTKQLKAWNDANPDDQISDLNELHTAFRIAFACHDLGNISADVLFDDEDSTDMNLADHYRGKGSEDRSKIIAQRFIQNSSIPDDQRVRIQEIVTHIIEQTKFGGQPQPDVPFWTLVQTIDQVGSAYFSQKDNLALVAGLIQERELQPEDERTLSNTLTLGGMAGFTNYVMGKSYPEEQQRSQIFTLFEGNPYNHTQMSFEFDDSLGSPEEIASMKHVPILMGKVAEKITTSTVLV